MPGNQLSALRPLFYYDSLEFVKYSRQRILNQVLDVVMAIAQLLALGLLVLQQGSAHPLGKAQFGRPAGKQLLKLCITLAAYMSFRMSIECLLLLLPYVLVVWHLTFILAVAL